MHQNAAKIRMTSPEACLGDKTEPCCVERPSTRPVVEPTQRDRGFVLAPARILIEKPLGDGRLVAMARVFLRPTIEASLKIDVLSVEGVISSLS